MMNDMKQNVFKMTALMAAMIMTMSAQAKTQDWGGRVIDEKGEPMPYVNVVLLSLPDSAFVQGAMTDMDGVFKIVTDVNDGLFKVTSVGYQTLYINAGQDLTIQMKEDTQLLKEVVVKGQLPKTHVKGDAMRTTVAGTILEKAGTLSDALSKIPSLEAERDGGVKVLGRGDAEVYINCAILMNREVWVASGHVGGFNDPLMDCKACKARFRADKLIEDFTNGEETGDGWTNAELEKFIAEHDIVCPVCGKKDFTGIRQFNLMFKTFAGVNEDSANEIYLRPETAQGIFVNFQNAMRTPSMCVASTAARQRAIQALPMTTR